MVFKKSNSNRNEYLGVNIDKPIYLGQSVSEISKTIMHEFWYHYNKPKYNDKVTICYMDKESLIIKIKPEDVLNENLVTFKR